MVPTVASSSPEPQLVALHLGLNLVGQRDRVRRGTVVSRVGPEVVAGRVARDVGANRDGVLVGPVGRSPCEGVGAAVVGGDVAVGQRVDGAAGLPVRDEGEVPRVGEGASQLDGLTLGQAVPQAPVGGGGVGVGDVVDGLVCSRGPGTGVHVGGRRGRGGGSVRGPGGAAGLVSVVASRARCQHHDGRHQDDPQAPPGPRCGRDHAAATPRPRVHQRKLVVCSKISVRCATYGT